MNFSKKLKDVFTTKVDSTSGKNEVNKTDIAKVVKTGVFVGIAAAISSILTSISPDTFGDYQPIITFVLTIVLDFTNKFIKNNKEIK